MRNIFLSLLLIVTIAANAMEVHREDSILRVLNKTNQPPERIQCYRNLADLCSDTPKEKNYLVKMYKEAKKINDKPAMINALDDIALTELNVYQPDSVQRYIQLIKQIATGEELKSILSYYHMRFFDILCNLGKRNEAIEKELSSSEGEADGLYREMVSAYITGNSLYINNKVEESVPYLETAAKLIKNLPKEDRVKFQKYILRRLAYAYCIIGQNLKGIELVKQISQEMELEYQTKYEKQRPFYPINTYRLPLYALLIANVGFMTPEQGSYYWSHVEQIGKSVKKPQDIYNYYLCANNYYLNNKIKIDYNKALAANDSLIKYAAILAPDNVPYLYEVNSQIYEVIKDHKNALQNLKIYHQMTDSLGTSKIQQQLNELQVQYDLDKVNHDKNQLEIKNKQNILLFLYLILAIAFIICAFLYFSLNRERRMKAELKRLHQKAQESENMKQAFINSVCHEIRTPLNSIVGFSDLLINPSIEEEIRKDFPALIQENTNILTSLIDGMIEVSNLDVSEEKLPCEPTDIRLVCEQQMEHLEAAGKSSIQYQLDIPEEPVMINTHKRYLSLVIENLLNNANKFTEEGHITLACKINNQENILSISVTDTGCGIPKDKYEAVFERFSKLDSFTQGNGLGLYLCRLVIKRLSGNIMIDSEYTQGTNFIISLPM